MTIQASLKNKVFNVNSEIKNMNELFYISFSLYDDSDRILDALEFRDIPDIDAFEWIRYDVALADGDENNEIDENDKFDFVTDYWSDGAIQLERIEKNSNLSTWLLNWYGFNKTTMQKNIRGFYETSEAFYFVHGVGYDALSSDLLGGSADGVALDAFYKFINNELDENAENVRNSIIKGV